MIHGVALRASNAALTVGAPPARNAALVGSVDASGLPHWANVARAMGYTSPADPFGAGGVLNAAGIAAPGIWGTFWEEPGGAQLPYAAGPPPTGVAPKAPQPMPVPAANQVKLLAGTSVPVTKESDPVARVVGTYKTAGVRMTEEEPTLTQSGTTVACTWKVDGVTVGTGGPSRRAVCTATNLADGKVVARTVGRYNRADSTFSWSFENKDSLPLVLTFEIPDEPGLTRTVNVATAPKEEELKDQSAPVYQGFSIMGQGNQDGTPTDLWAFWAAHCTRAVVYEVKSDGEKAKLGEAVPKGFVEIPQKTLRGRTSTLEIVMFNDYNGKQTVQTRKLEL